MICRSLRVSAKHIHLPNTCNPRLEITDDQAPAVHNIFMFPSTTQHDTGLGSKPICGGFRIAVFFRQRPDEYRSLLLP
jgi:hypothetical protein